MVTRRDCQSLIQKNDEDCQKIWMEIINVLSEDTKRAIDQHLQLALASMNDEMRRGISIITDAPKKRKRVDADDITDPQPRDKIDTSSVHVNEAFQSVDNGAFQIIKRQRLRAPSLSLAQQKQKQDLADNELKQLALIEQLKLKIKQQEETIATLAEENNKVGRDSERSGE